MRPLTPIVRLIHGSRLYGTATPTSDTDYKGVHIPSGEAILLGRPEDVITRDIRAADAARNGPGDVDDQSYSLAKFLKMVSVGDTVATEMLFAPGSAIISRSPVWEMLQTSRHRLVNRECRGFVRYCIQQAAKYSIKGDRLAACEAAVTLLETGLADQGPNVRLGAIRPALEAFAADPAHFAGFETVPGQHGPIEHFVCLDRKTPLTTRIFDALSLYRRIHADYGKRAAAAMTAGGIDWKAMSHAVRVARQAEELLSTGHLTLPRPDAADLIEIKLGQRPYEAVQDELETIVERLPSLVERSRLPEASEADWIRAFILEAHRGQVTGELA